LILPPFTLWVAGLASQGHADKAFKAAFGGVGGHAVFRQPSSPSLAPGNFPANVEDFEPGLPSRNRPLEVDAKSRSTDFSVPRAKQ